MSLPKNKESISISIDSWLIEEMDAYCERKDRTRSLLVSMAVRKFLLSEKDSPELWNEFYQKRNNES